VTVFLATALADVSDEDDTALAPQPTSTPTSIADTIVTDIIFRNKFFLIATPFSIFIILTFLI
jgi:hypothetical protein